ncbi:MAG: tetratricopeptide repeat protein, partial [Bacteroidetes bacterium]|nr:tetratricopeptide repeat protein [Bacteroidota bacterium]
MKALTLVLSVLICVKFGLGQNSKIDSLQNVLETATVDTNIVSTLNELSIELYSVGNYEEALHFAENAKQSANKFIVENSNKNTTKILKKGLAKAHNTVGNIYSDQGIYPDALQNYYISLKIKEKIGDTKGIASAYNNIGIVYKTQGNYTDALNSYKTSLKIKKQLGDKQGIASSYNNIANIYHIQGNFSQAIENYSNSLQLFKELDFIPGITFLYNNIGGVYFNQAEQEKDSNKKNTLFSNARDNYNASLALFEEISDKRGVVASLINLGTIDLKQKNIPKAKEYANRALALSKNEKSGEMLKDIYNLLAQIETSFGNYKQAFDFYKVFIQLRDSIFNEENTKKTVQMQMQFGFDKKMAADSIANAKEQELKEVEIARQKAEIKVKKNQQYGLFGGLFLVIVFAGFMYNRFTITRKQKQIIELQKQEVEQQKEIVEEKNKEITDSIQYAKRIQNAILPPIKFVKEHLPQSFIVYKPKDIVAGDFYWLETIKSDESRVLRGENPSLNTHHSQLVLFAACDCTGHGVPGAMVSVVCVNGLNRSVREHGITDPGKILDKTREIVIQEFEKSDDVVKDGMDISICALQGNILKWAGANNPLWIIRLVRHSGLDPESHQKIAAHPDSYREHDKYEIIEYKPNKQHIGKIENPKPFITHTIELQKNDTFYIFTDGYQDQFGGENGKKFKSSKLKELLI